MSERNGSDAGDGNGNQLNAPGIADSDGAETSQELIEAVDEALYTAKNNGKNRVERFPVAAAP